MRFLRYPRPKVNLSNALAWQQLRDSGIWYTGPGTLDTDYLSPAVVCRRLAGVVPRHKTPPTGCLCFCCTMKRRSLARSIRQLENYYGRR